MKLYSENDNYKLYSGSMLDMLDAIEKESVDSIITDPPYELNFMNKGWDNSGIAFQPNTWRKCYEVLKPGGYLLAFGGSRTFHRIACAIEDAGFEIRDTIMWLYGSGFPKSMNVGKSIDKRNGVQPIARKEPTGGITGGKNTGAEEKGWHSINNWYEYPECKNEWKGWGTALKPSFEPIIVARKPFKGSLVDNVIEYGVGGINIDECRVEFSNEKDKDFHKKEIDRVLRVNTPFNNSWKNCSNLNNANPQNEQGRFPANTILTYDDTDYDEVCGEFPDTKGGKRHNTTKRIVEGTSYYKDKEFLFNRNEYNDSGSASRYFYCAKASKKDRDEGLDIEEQVITDGRNKPIDNAFNRGETLRKNIHPTVKPTELMQYLVRLVSPKGSTILDCFNGSGSTGKAVMYENKERNANYKYIGIELTPEYLPISKARIEYVMNNDLKPIPKEQEEQAEGQTNIFDFIGE